MSDILAAIDAATGGLCPCGADPQPGSAYCGDDCRPTHISADTDTRMAGHLATAARWRPNNTPDTLDDPWADVASHWWASRQPRTVQLRAVSATITVRFDDGSEQEVRLHEGGELDITFDEQQDTEDLTDGFFTRPVMSGPRRYRIELDAAYGRGATPDGAHMTIIRRPAPE